jgi:K+-sensing histidine kinase KdpD
MFFQQTPKVLVWDYMYPENIVEAHGGKIIAQNNASDGIRYMFSFHIPKSL